MSNIVSSKGYSSSYRGSNTPGAFYQVLTSDFGANAPAAPTLTLRAATGTLASSTANVKITWITAEGVSLPSVNAAIVISGANDGLTVAIPAIPTNGATVIGWQVYSQGSTGAVLLDSASTSTVPSPISITTTQGVVTGFPIATTSIFLNSYGTGAGVPTVDLSGIQPALPSVPAAGSATAAGGSADYYFIVPNAGSQWKNYKPVGVMRPDSVAETAGISASYPFDCQSPLYPGATPGASTYTQVSVAPGTYMVMGGNLFVATQTGSQNIAASFIGAAAFQVTKGTTVTDGSVTWYCLGKATLVHARFENTGNAAAIPTAQEYDLYEN
jgi:hypothetical protein